MFPSPSHWRQRGKEFLIGKQLDIQLTDFEQINSIFCILFYKLILVIKQETKRLDCKI